MTHILSYLNQIQSRRTPWLRWLMLIGWMAAIFAFSNQSSLLSFSVSWFDLVVKKTAHATAYGILFLLWMNVLHPSNPRSHRTILLALTLTFVYAISDEWHQTFIAGRHGQPLDVAIDMSGVFIAAAWIQKIGRRQNYRFDEGSNR